MVWSFYEIDGRDRIVNAGGGWDRFALENGGQGATSHHIMGTWIWDHIKEFDVSSYLNAVFFSARRKQAQVVLPYRCDSPSQPRLFKMTVAPTAGLGLMVEHVQLLHQLTLQLDETLTLSDHNPEIKCSICCAFKVDDAWVDPFSRPETFEFPKGLGICPSCRQNTLAAIQQLDEGEGGRVVKMSSHSGLV